MVTFSKKFVLGLITTIFLSGHLLQAAPPVHSKKIHKKEGVRFSLSDLGFDLGEIPGLFFTEGVTTILDGALHIQAISGDEYLALQAGMSKNFKLDQIIPGIENTFINDIDLSAAQIIVSTGRFTDQDSGLDIKPGINLLATVKPIGPLKLIHEYLPFVNPKLQMIATIGTSLQDLAMKIIIPGLIEIEDVLRFSSFILEITGDGPSLSLITKVDIKPTPQDDWLFFTGRIQLNPKSANGSATMEGTWNNPLGFVGFALSNLALELGFDYKVAAATVASYGIPLPSIFGITGQTKVGTATAKGALKLTVGTNITNQLLQLKIKHLIVKDLAMQYNTMVEAAGMPPTMLIPLQSIPHIGLDDVEIYCCPQEAHIGEIPFEQGIHISGRIELFDKFAMVRGALAAGGIELEGSMSPLDIGPLHITGAGQDDDPAMSLELKPHKQEIFLSGGVEFFGNRCKTEVFVTTSEITFFAYTKLFNLFEVMLEGQAVGSSQDFDFVFSGEFRNDFYETLKQNLAKTDSADQPIKIKKACITGSAKDIFKKGLFPKVILELAVGGKELEPITLQLDLADSVVFIDQITKAIVTATEVAG